MKNIIVILALLFVGNLSAQELSKQEKADLLEEIKLLKKNPEKLKTMKETLTVRDVIITDQNKQIADLKKEIQQKDIAKSNLSDSLAYLNTKLLAAEKAVVYTSNGNEPPLDHNGMKYRVQIGVFKNYDITHLFDDPKYIVHEDVNGLHRYSVGNFNSMEDAEAFKVEMRRLGIKDAFVSTYKDGTRIDDKPNYSSQTVAPVKTTSQPTVQKVEVSAPKASTNGFNNAKPVYVYPNKQVESNPMTYPVKQVESNPAPLDAPQTTSPTKTEVKTNTQPEVKTTTQPESKPIIVQPEETKSSGIKINLNK
jgi:hypothetical protein